MIGASLFALVLMFSSVQPVAAQAEPPLQEIVHFEDDVERQRYFRLIKEYRCPKCQNQNLLDSNSQISIDLRNTVADLIREGKTDRQIDRYMVDRYGDFVLYKPQIKGSTSLLYYGPIAFVVIGIVIFIILLVLRSKKRSKPQV